MSSINNLIQRAQVGQDGRVLPSISDIFKMSLQDQVMVLDGLSKKLGKTHKEILDVEMSRTKGQNLKKLESMSRELQRRMEEESVTERTSDVTMVETLRTTGQQLQGGTPGHILAAEITREHQYRQSLERTPLPESKKNVEVVSIRDPNLTQTSVSLDEITQLFRDLQYSGFSSHKVRLTVMANMTRKDLVKVLQTYIMVGNNYVKRLRSVNNDNTATQISEVLARYNIKTHKVTGDHLTLSRIAIAFSPVVYFLRKLARDSKLLNSMNIRTSVDPLVCDLCFVGCQLNPLIGDITDFSQKMSTLFRRHKEKMDKREVVWTESQIKEDSLHWEEIAQNGYMSDPVIFGPWDIVDGVQMNAFRWIDRIFNETEKLQKK